MQVERADELERRDYEVARRTTPAAVDVVRVDCAFATEAAVEGHVVADEAIGPPSDESEKKTLCVELLFRQMRFATSPEIWAPYPVSPPPMMKLFSNVTLRVPG